MALERFWLEVPAQPLTSNGGAYGQISIPSTVGIKVQQKVQLFSNVQPNMDLEVKRVINETDIILGPLTSRSLDYTDLTLFLVSQNATLIIPEQSRSSIILDGIWRSCFEEEPTVALRIFEVDHLGRPYGSTNPRPAQIIFNRNGNYQEVLEDTSDPTNNRPLPVKLTGFDGDVSITADNLNLDIQTKGVYSLSNDNPDNIALIGHSRSVSTDETNQTERITAKRGTTNTDTVSQDVALHTDEGNALSYNSGDADDETIRVVIATDQPPVPVSITSIAIPEGASTEDKQDVGNSSLSSIDDKLDINHTDLVAIKTDIDSTNTKLDSLISASHVDLVAIKTDIDSTNIKLDTSNTKLDSLISANHTDLVAIKTDIDSTNTKLDILHADNVNIETKQDTGNTSLSSIDTKTIAKTSSTSSISRISSSATSVQLLASTPSRLGVILVNDSTSSCYVKFGTTASTVSFTYLMTSGSTLILDQCPIYSGRIDAIWVSANGAMQITELT